MRAAAFLISAVSLEKAISIGLRSGLYGGPGQEPGTHVAQGCRRGRALVAGEIVQNDNVAGPERRDQLGFGIKVEHLGVHCAIDHPRRVQPVMAQSCNEGLAPPMSERRMIDEALPAGCPSCGLGHVRLDPGLIDERQSLQMVGHERLASRDPDMAQSGDVLALLFKRLQSFFYGSVRAPAERAKRWHGARRCHASQPVRPRTHQA